MASRTFLVTGGTGYIGSHTVLVLLEAGHNVIVVDNLCNSSLESLKRVANLVFGIPDLDDPVVSSHLQFHQLDIRDTSALNSVFEQNPSIWGVIHIAGLKSVKSSIENPALYYSNNVQGSASLFECMQRHKVFNIVFASSACVYGEPRTVPITERFPLAATNPYGECKIAIELNLRELFQNHPGLWRVVILRYFNPIGAHASGKIGEDPRGSYANLLPILSQVTQGKLEKFVVFGNDYGTEDGTAIRDYIHVMDLANGIMASLAKFNGESGYWAFNLGTGRGYSVLQVLTSYQSVCGVSIPHEFKERRPGDVPVLIADPTVAERELNWKAKKNLHEMCHDFWRWQTQNPNGYSPERVESTSDDEHPL